MKLGQLVPNSVKSSSLYRRLHPRALFNAFRKPADVFTKIYATNDWGGEHGVLYSGSGSRGSPAEEYVALIKNFISQHNVRNVLDLGCGDFFIGRHIAAASDHYVGIYVVPSVIQRFGQFKYVIVSEHYPHPNEFKAPNRDTAAGAGTRVTFGSAVVLDQPPFSISCTELSRSAAPQRDDGLQDSYTRGSIRTFLVHPK